ncbi:MAG: transcription antitermination factor NusB [Alphaproteobacteria bacterium]|nr:transcription antitermination factor NusB [Alphaproteobacteria bacterium]
MNRRRAARFGAVQALYQAELSGQDIELVIAEFQAHRLADLLEPLELEGPAPVVDRNWFLKVAKGAYDATDDLDQRIEQTLSSGWSLMRLGFLLRAFLRAGAFELFHCPDVPSKAVINEYLDLAHAFLEKDDTGFLNAVLDRLAAEARTEASAGRSEPAASSDA